MIIDQIHFRVDFFSACPLSPTHSEGIVGEQIYSGMAQYAVFNPFNAENTFVYKAHKLKNL